MLYRRQSSTDCIPRVAAVLRRFSSQQPINIVGIACSAPKNGQKETVGLGAGSGGSCSHGLNSQVPSWTHVPVHAARVVMTQKPFPTQHEPVAVGGHSPQSWGQLLHVSFSLHCPSPQFGWQAPQSCGQVPHVSPPLHAPSPQVAGHWLQFVFAPCQLPPSVWHWAWVWLAWHGTLGMQQAPVGCGQGLGLQVPPLVQVPLQLACVVTEQVPLAAQHEPVGCAQGLGLHD